MAPTVLRKDDQLIGIGSPGGSRIPMMLTEALIRHLKFHESLESAIEAPRFYMEDNKIYSEIRYSRGIRNELEEMGYDIELKSSPIYYGGIQAIVIDKGKSVIFGSADSRREGTWKVK